ncbi:MAG: ABC transporter ATP-binding protein [Actinomycetota bacterium]
MIVADALVAGYGETTIIDGLELAIEPGTITTLVGPNGCGKSTLLKCLSGAFERTSGSVTLHGDEVSSLSRREIAQRLAVLPQSPVVPEFLTVLRLVEQGRFAAYGAMGMLRSRTDDAVTRALEITAMTGFADRAVTSLSGGERQRAWMALTIAQDTDTLLLDEPTTYLDVGYQLDVLDLVRTLNREHTTTVVMVLHDLNQAVSYSDRIVAMSNGQIVADGAPGDVITVELLRDVFEVDASLVDDPRTGRPVMVPHTSTRPSPDRRTAITASG